MPHTMHACNIPITLPVGNSHSLAIIIIMIVSGRLLVTGYQSSIDEVFIEVRILSLRCQQTIHKKRQATSDGKTIEQGSCRFHGCMHVLMKSCMCIFRECTAYKGCAIMCYKGRQHQMARQLSRAHVVSMGACMS
jgi:hypothetical protein